MGLIDRDYMRREEHRPTRPVSGPPEPSAAMTLSMILVFMAVTYGAYEAWHWWHPPAGSQPAGTKVSAPPVQPAPANRRAAAINDSGTDRSSFEPPVPAYTEPPATQVAKCIVNGRTSYSDGACPVQARSSVVTLRSGENVAEGLPESVRRQALATPAVPVPALPVVSPPAQSAQDRGAVCHILEEQIKAIDARARQPLPPAEQDRLTAERRAIRDQEFHIGC